MMQMNIAEEQDFGLAVRRRIPNQNCVNFLRDREMHFSRPGCETLQTRKYYLIAAPNFTVSNVDKPSGYPRKFTPDGRYLIEFTPLQNGVSVYAFRGSHASGELLRTVENRGDLPTSEFSWVDLEAEENLRPIRLKAFNVFFRHEHTATLAHGNEQLNREFSLFTPDSRYVIVAASCVLPEDQYPHVSEQYSNNESLPPGAQFQPEDYYLYCVHISSGQLTDTKAFKYDKIFLPHNQGVCLYDRTLAVLSVLHQCVHIFLVDESGIFVPRQTVGRFAFDDDEFFWNRCMEPTYVPTAYDAKTGRQLATRKRPLEKIQKKVFDNGASIKNGFTNSFFAPIFSSCSQMNSDEPVTASTSSSVPANQRMKVNQRFSPFADPMLNTPKQRLLAYIFQREKAEGVYETRDFYRRFDTWRNLRMWRMQLLDENILLIRYTSPDVVSQKSDPNAHVSQFVFYDTRTSEILAVYDSMSAELLRLFEICDHDFRGYTIDRYASTISNSLEVRKSHELFKETIVNAKFGGETEATRRVLTHLPISAQSFNTSPYFDFELFSYDEKFVSPFERPKKGSEYPLRFYGRKCGTLKFQLHCASNTHIFQSSQTPRTLVAFIFHPHEPFAISVHRINRDYVVNFHVRYFTTMDLVGNIPNVPQKNFSSC